MNEDDKMLGTELNYTLYESSFYTLNNQIHKNKKHSKRDKYLKRQLTRNSTITGLIFSILLGIALQIEDIGLSPRNEFLFLVAHGLILLGFIFSAIISMFIKTKKGNINSTDEMVDLINRKIEKNKYSEKNWRNFNEQDKQQIIQYLKNHITYEQKREANLMKSNNELDLILDFSNCLLIFGIGILAYILYRDIFEQNIYSWIIIIIIFSLFLIINSYKTKHIKKKVEN